jgi:hypothetical protein
MTWFEWNLQDAGVQSGDDHMSLGVVEAPAAAAVVAAAYYVLVAQEVEYK